MQLDFFRQLTTLLRPAPKLEPPATPPPAGSDPTLEAQARELFRALGCEALAKKIRVVWNPRMRSTAGTAHAARSLVTLNARLPEFGAEEIDRTLRHELAHLLAHHRAGRRRIAPHGPEWRQACCDLGLTDEKRCHDLPLPRRKMHAALAYRCPECAVVIPRVRPLRRKSACLACCRRFSRGRYDERFRLVRVAPQK